MLSVGARWMECGKYIGSTSGFKYRELEVLLRQFFNQPPPWVGTKLSFWAEALLYGLKCPARYGNLPVNQVL